MAYIIALAAIFCFSLVASEGNEKSTFTGRSMVVAPRTTSPSLPISITANILDENEPALSDFDCQCSHDGKLNGSDGKRHIKNALDDFKATCSKLNGVIDDGQCFFLIRNATSWSNSWSLCQQQGAALAQVLSQNEYKSILKMAQNLKIDGRRSAWIALQRDKGACSQAVAPNVTYWYSNSTNKATSADNTWMIYFYGNDPGPCDGQCLVLYDINKVGATFWVYDDNCDKPAIPAFPLCQISSPRQTYSATHTCMKETPIQTFASVNGIQDCAVACASSNSCRSFNFVKTGGCGWSCELFAWLNDRRDCPECPRIKSQADCYHYNVEP